MDININVNVNSQPIVEMAQNLNNANSEAKNLNETLSNKTPENQVIKNTNSIGKAGKAMTGLRSVVTGFDKLIGTQFGEAADVIGTFGTSFVGLGRIVPFVSGAFQSFGAVLKANPIFFIASIITGVVVALGFLLDSFGLLQPIIEGLTAPIKFLIDGLKSLVGVQEDYTAALEESGNAAENFDKKLKNLNTRFEEEERILQNQIDLLRAKGATDDEIADAERKLLDKRIANNSSLIADTKESLADLVGFDRKLIQNASDAQIKQLAENQKAVLKSRAKTQEEEKKVIEKFEKDFDKIQEGLRIARRDRDQSITDLEIFDEDRKRKKREEAIRNTEKANEKADKKKKEQESKNLKAEADRRKAEQEALAAFQKRLKKETEELKEISEDKLLILKQELLSGKITEETFSAEKLLLEKETNDKIIELKKNQKLTEEEQVKVGLDNVAKITLDTEEKNAKEIRALRQKNADIDLTIFKNNEKDKTKATQDEEKNRIETLDREFLQKKIDLLNNDLLNEKQLAEALKQLEIDKNKARLELLQVGSSEYLALKAQIAQQELDIDKKKADEQKKLDKDVRDATLELGIATFESLSTISDIYFQSRINQAKGNAVEEERLAKKQFKVNKAFQLGVAVLNGIQSVLAITSTAVDPTGVSTALRVAAQVALNVASIAKIAATPFGGGSAASAPGPNTPDIQPGVSSAPSFNLFGQGNQMNVSSAQPTTTVSDPQGNTLRIIAEVSETEITAVQNRNRRYSNSAEL